MSLSDASTISAQESLRWWKRLTVANGHTRYRADIDGLRAVAVTSVVLFHVAPGLLPGGFTGVDVFFVISGYLISGIIFRELSQGHFSALDFYTRRVRRIFPALLLVLATSMACGWVLLFSHEFRHLGRQVAAGAAFIFNLSVFSDQE